MRSVLRRRWLRCKCSARTHVATLKRQATLSGASCSTGHHTPGYPHCAMQQQPSCIHALPLSMRESQTSHWPRQAPSPGVCAPQAETKCTLIRMRVLKIRLRHACTSCLQLAISRTAQRVHRVRQLCPCRGVPAVLQRLRRCATPPATTGGAARSMEHEAMTGRCTVCVSVCCHVSCGRAAGLH